MGDCADCLRTTLHYTRTTLEKCNTSNNVFKNKQCLLVVEGCNYTVFISAFNKLL